MTDAPEESASDRLEARMSEAAARLGMMGLRGLNVAAWEEKGGPFVFPNLGDLADIILAEADRRAEAIARRVSGH